VAHRGGTRTNEPLAKAYGNRAGVTARRVLLKPDGKGRCLRYYAWDSRRQVFQRDLRDLEAVDDLT